jgi:hypothetical protein
MSLPGWIFYAENSVPQEGEVFVVEKVEPNTIDHTSGEKVTFVTMRPMYVRTHPFPPSKLIERTEE